MSNPQIISDIKDTGHFTFGDKPILLKTVYFHLFGFNSEI